jgi:hypothetical protein
MSAVNKKPAHDPDEPRIDLSKTKRGRSRFADKRLELPLSELRASANKTQLDVSRASGIPQGEVSKIENRADLDVVAIATLRKYIHALGGELELVARFPNGARVVARQKA